MNPNQAAPAVACNIISYPSTLAVEREQATIILNREKGLYIALVRWPPCELNISCTSTTAESRTKIWYQ